MLAAPQQLIGNGILGITRAPEASVPPTKDVRLDEPGIKCAAGPEILLGDVRQPEQIAAAVGWMASAEAEQATGTIIVVDGGMWLSPKFA